MIINATIASGSPAGFAQAVDDAVAFYESTFSNNVTVNITFSEGVINGNPHALATNGLDGGAGWNNYSYSSVIAALAAVNGGQSVLPSTDPFAATDGGMLSVAPAEAVALGLASTVDVGGFVELGSGVNWSYDPSNVGTSQHDAVGAIEHELSETMMGRSCGSNGVSANGTPHAPIPSPLALFRYNAGVIDTSDNIASSNGDDYFSFDGGVTNMHGDMGETNGDLADWGGPSTDDCFGFGGSGKLQFVTPADVTVMEALGWTAVDNWLFAAPGGWSTGGFWSVGAPSAATQVQIQQGEVVVNGGAAALSVYNSATLFLANVPLMSVGTYFENQGTLDVDTGAGDSGSALSIGGVLYNTQLSGTPLPTITIAASGADLTSTTSINATGLLNSGIITLSDHTGDSSLLQIIGGVAENDGTINIGTNSEADFGDQVTGSGAIQIDALGALFLGGDQAAGQTVDDSAAEIAGAGGVEIFTKGTVILGVNNTYTGLTSVAEGALEFENTSATAPGSLPGTSIFLGTGTAVAFDNADTIDNSYVVSQVISGAGAVVFNGPNDAITDLGAANTYMGGTTITGGIVDVSNNAAFGAASVLILGNGAIRADHGAKTLANKFQMSGTVGLGDFTNISGAITLLGATNVTASKNAGNSTWSGAMNIGAFTFGTSDAGANTDGATWAGENLTISGAISGTGGVTQDSLGGLILAGANTYSGTTTVAEGVLEVLNKSTTSEVGALGTGAVAIDAGALLTFDNADTKDGNYVAINVISGAGEVEFAGPDDAVTTLSQTNTYTGGTLIKSGIVDVFSPIGEALGKGTVTMTGGALRATAAPQNLANAFVLSGVIGMGSATSIAGAVTLAGATEVTASENAGGDTWSGAVSLGAFALATSDVGPDTDGATWAGQNLTISGAISGTGGVTQDSAGGLILSGVNAYTGATLVEKGALQLAAADNIDTSKSLTLDAGSTLELTEAGVPYTVPVILAGAATVDVNFNFNSPDTFSGIVSGSGPLTITGSGELILENNDDSYTGGTIVDGSRLGAYDDDVLGEGGLTLENGAFVDLGHSTIGAAISVADDDTLFVFRGNVAKLTGKIADGASAGALFVTGGGDLVLSDDNNSYSGGTTIDSDTTVSISADDDMSGGPLTFDDDSTLQVTSGNPVLGNNINLGGVANISGTGGSLTLNGTIADLGSNTGGVSFSGGDNFYLDGGDTYTGQTSVVGSNLELFGPTTSYAGDFSIDSASTLFLYHSVSLGSLQGAGAIRAQSASASVTLTVGDDNSSESFTGSFFQVEGLVNLTKVGTGSLELDGAQTYTGATLVDDGVLTLDDNVAALTGDVTVNAPGALSVDVDVSLGSLSGGGTVDLHSVAGVTLTVGTDNASTTFSGGLFNNFPGPGSLVKVGTGTLTLSGDSNYGGSTTVAKGVLEVLNASANSDAGMIRTGPFVIDAGAELIFANADTVNDGYVLSDADDQQISGAGALVFKGADDSVTTLDVSDTQFTGATTIRSGIVNIENSSAFGSGVVTMTGGAIRATQLPAFLGNNFNLSGVIGIGAATNFEGAVTLKGSTTFTASENAGSSALSGAVSLGAFTLATGDVGPSTDGATWSGRDLTISGAISGAGGITQNSSGGLILSDANTYTGQTLIEAGALEVDAAGALGTSAVLIKTNAELEFGAALTLANNISINGVANFVAASGQATLTGVISNNGLTAGAITFAKGLYALSAANLYGGGTTIENGATVTLTGAGSLGAGAATIDAGATLDLTGAVGIGAGGLTLDAGGFLDIASGAAPAIKGTSSLSGEVEGAGTFDQAAGSATLNVGATMIVANWTIASGAAATIAKNLSYAGILTAKGGSTITIDSGETLALSGTTSLAGSVAGAGTLAAAGGTTTLSAGPALSMTNLAVRGTATTLSVASHTTYAGTLNEAAGTTIDVVSGDSFTTTGAATYNGTVSGAGSLSTTGGTTTFNGSATNNVAGWNISGATTTLKIVDENLSYQGAFSIEAGAAIAVANGSDLQLEGTSTLGGGTIGGAGAFVLEGGTATISGGAAVTVMTWEVEGGTTTIEKSLAYGGAFVTDESATLTLSGTGAALSLTGHATLTFSTINGAGALTTSAKTGSVSTAGLTLGGTVIWTDGEAVTQNGGNLTLGDSSNGAARLNLTTTGVYDITDDTGIALGGTGASSITNSGALEKTAGAGVSVIAAGITNSGLISATSGTLDLHGSIAGPGVDEVGGGATLQFDGSVAATQTVKFATSGGEVSLDDLHVAGVQLFHATLSGWAAGDSLDVGTTFGTGTTFNFVENGGNASGVLHLTDGTATAAIAFAGDFSNANFTPSINASGATVLAFHA